MEINTSSRRNRQVKAYGCKQKRLKQNTACHRKLFEKRLQCMPSNLTFWPFKSKWKRKVCFSRRLSYNLVKKNRNLEKECKIKQLRKSSGSIIKIIENTYTLVDTPGQ